MIEKRKQERYALDAPIRIKSIDDISSSTFEAYCKDISSTGIYIKTSDKKLQSMQNVKLELVLTIEKLKELFGLSTMVTLEVNGAVVRALQDGIGVEFQQGYSIFPAGYFN